MVLVGQLSEEIGIPIYVHSLSQGTFDIKTKKKLIGFNQLDLWSGGHQTNRASKYVKNDDFHEKYKKYNIKIISIICTKIEISSRKNKVFTLFKEGIEKQRLFYPKQLCNFINKYFTS